MIGGVGKTTFIKLLITGTYTEHNEKVLRENIIIDTKKFGIKYYNYPVELIDGSLMSEKEELPNFIKDCNLVVLMYDFHNQNSLNKIKFEILPLLANNENIYSIIVVGNKIDLLDINTQKFVIEQDKTEIEKMQDEIGVNLKYFYISCKNYSGISSLFSEILNSLVHPSHIFYTQKNDEVVFTEKFEKAFRRIFRIFDRERKGKITKQEFNKIHENIFDIKLESDHMTAIKECIKIINSISKGSEASTGISNEDEISLDGFISLNKLAVQVGESQTVWSTIRKFGYNDNLELDNWYFKAKKLNKLDMNDYVIELSENAKGLLTGLFIQCKNAEKSKKDSSKTFITESEWNDIFYTSALPLNETFSFEKIFRKNKTDGLISLDDWIFFWTCLTRINYEEAFKYFLYLGFDVEFDQFARKNKKSEVNLFNQIEHKTIYICFIAQNQENINNFVKYFKNFFTIAQGTHSKQRDIIIKAYPYSIILSHYLINEIEVSISNVTTNTVNSFKKFDLLVFSDDVINSKIFSYFALKIPYFVFYSDPCNVPATVVDKKTNGISLTTSNGEYLVDTEKMSDKDILDKILSFAKEPINYLKVSERKEVIRERRRNYILFGLKFLFYGVGAFVSYYVTVKKYNLFK